MFSSAFAMVMLMLIPVAIFVYTINFGRWMKKRKETMGAFTVYLLACVSLIATGISLWRIVA